MLHVLTIWQNDERYVSITNYSKPFGIRELGFKLYENSTNPFNIDFQGNDWRTRWQASSLNSSPLIPHICVNELGQHWLWLVAYSAPSHYLNQIWLIVNCNLRNKLQWNSNQNTKLFILENAFKCCLRQPLGRWVNVMPCVMSLHGNGFRITDGPFFREIHRSPVVSREKDL